MVKLRKLQDSFASGPIWATYKALLITFTNVIHTQHDSEDPSELESEKRLEVKGQEDLVKEEVKVEGTLEAAKALDEEGNKLEQCRTHFYRAG